ncbi:MAG: acetoacetate decarboxylase family protein [Deltaproteobacteria bacterium]|nr:acetoacetate decarboxylase family protein [Deltaproteobacteria bacterium]
MRTFFDGTRPGRPVSVGSASFELPIQYYRDDAFVLFFPAPLAALERALPTPRLKPVPLLPGRGAVAIAAFNYLNTSIGPYGEVAVAIPVTLDRRAPPLVGALLESRFPSLGLFVCHLPVTHLVARDAGRGIWGYPKFVADMRFEYTPERLGCSLSEEGQHILSVEVARGGLCVEERRPIVTYTVKGRELVRTIIPARGTARLNLGARGCSLRLGEHPVAESIRALGLGARPVFARYYVERAAILPVGEVVDGDVAPHEGYRGRERQGVHDTVYLGGE